MQVRIGVQELVSSDFTKQNIPFMIEMADKDAVAYTKLLHTIDPKVIQIEFLEMFAEFQFKPTTILVSGLFGVYLSNVLTPLAKRMSIKIKQVDNLPTFNRLTQEERIVFIFKFKRDKRVKIHLQKILFRCTMSMLSKSV